MSTQEIKEAIQKQSIGYIIAALSLVAGLAWNEAIKDMITVLFPLQKDSLFIKFLYAIIITVVVTIITVYLNRSLQSSAEKK